MASPTIQAPESAERVNSIGRVFGVIFSPKATFESIARRPTWLLPMLLVTLISLSIIGLFGHRVGWRSFFEKQAANSSRFQQLPPDQQERSLQLQLKYGPPYVYAIGAISPAIAAVVIAAVFLGLFNLVFGARLGFKTSLSIVAHSWMTGVVSGLLGVLIIFLKDPSTVDLQNLIASNAGAFLSSDSPKWLIALGTSFDLFTFWTMILMAIGYSVAAPKKLSFGKAFVSIVVVWLLVVLLRVGAAAAFS
jgi:hypothetical protein